jgi:hypothetical protein
MHGCTLQGAVSRDEEHVSRVQVAMGPALHERSGFQQSLSNAASDPLDLCGPLHPRRPPLLGPLLQMERIEGHDVVGEGIHFSRLAMNGCPVSRSHFAQRLLNVCRFEEGRRPGAPPTRPHDISAFEDTNCDIRGSCTTHSPTAVDGEWAASGQHFNGLELSEGRHGFPRETLPDRALCEKTWTCRAAP